MGLRTVFFSQGGGRRSELTSHERQVLGRVRRRPWLLVLSFTLAQMANRGFTDVFWALPRLFLAGSAAAGGSR